MRHAFISLAAISTIILVMACSGKKNGEHSHGGDEHHAAAGDWTAMDEFHMVMAESFHPFSDSANLEPAKENADSLVAVATRWAASPLPDRFEDDDEIRFKLDQLKSDASTFEQTVEAGDEKAIGESLTKLHNLFHAIQESWYNTAEH
jgi:hypothetical protein